MNHSLLETDVRREDIPAELVELAQFHGIDLDTLPTELSDEDLEAVIGGKGPVFVGPGYGYGWGRPWRRRGYPYGPRRVARAAVRGTARRAVWGPRWGW